MNLKRLTILVSSIQSWEKEKKYINNKIFWKRDNRREEENSQFLVILGIKSNGINF